MPLAPAVTVRESGFHFLLPTGAALWDWAPTSEGWPRGSCPSGPRMSSFLMHCERELLQRLPQIDSQKIQILQKEGRGPAFLRWMKTI